MASSEATPPEHETDALAERFFSQPPAPPYGDDDDWHPAPLSTTERLAMLGTLAPVGIGVAVAIGVLLFSDPSFASSADSDGGGGLGSLGTDLQKKSASAPERAAQEPTRYGLTALAKAMAAQALESAPEAALPAAAPAQIEAVAIAAVPAPAPIAKAARRAARRAAPGIKPPSSLLKRARLALDAGNASEARSLAQDAVRRAPDQAAAYIVLGGALDKLGDRAGMKAVFRTCAERAQDALASACKSLAR